VSRSNFPPQLATTTTHFVIRVGGKAAGFMETRGKAEELAELLNAIPGCPAVTVDELLGPFPADYDRALQAVRTGKPLAPPPRPAQPALRLVRGGR